MIYSILDRTKDFGVVSVSVENSIFPKGLKKILVFFSWRKEIYYASCTEDDVVNDIENLWLKEHAMSELLQSRN